VFPPTGLEKLCELIGAGEKSRSFARARSALAQDDNASVLVERRKEKTASVHINSADVLSLAVNCLTAADRAHVVIACALMLPPFLPLRSGNA